MTVSAVPQVPEYTVFVTLYYPDADVGRDVLHVVRHKRFAMRGNWDTVTAQTGAVMWETIREFDVSDEDDDEVFAQLQVRPTWWSGANNHAAEVANFHTELAHIVRRHGTIHIHEMDELREANNLPPLAQELFDTRIDEIAHLLDFLRKDQNEIIGANDPVNERALNARNRDNMDEWMH